MQAKRVIYIADPKSLDLQNVGLHFTASRQYIHGYLNPFQVEDDNRYMVTFRINGELPIHEGCTEMSNENYPKEREVVLMPDEEMTCTLVIVDRKQRTEKVRRNVKINTGQRCDRWVKKMMNYYSWE